MNVPASTTIRPARRPDREALGRLAGQLVRMHHAWNPLRFLQIPNVEAGYGSWLVKEAHDAEALVLVAEREEQVVGYLYARFEERDWNALLGPHAALHDILVDPSVRRSGAGTLLLEGLRAACRERGFERVVLHTAVQNEAGQALFRHFGFAPTMIEMTYELGAPKVGNP